MTSSIRLGDLCDMRSGGTPRRGVSGYFGGRIPWVTIADMSASDGVVRDTAECITEAGLDAIGRRLFQPGTILLAMYGSVGKLAIAGCRLATNQAILGLQPRDPKVLDSGYLKSWLASIQAKLVFDARGVTQANISKGLVEELRIPLPPLPEQRRIADILDKADAIRRKRKEAIALTEELLRSAFLEMFGDPVTNPKGWEVKPLTELADMASGVTKGKRYDNQKTVTLPYMRVANVQDGHLVLDEVKTITVSEDEGQRYLLQDGDVLLTEGGDPDKLGRGTVWRNEVPGCIHQNHIFRVRPHGAIKPEYLSAIIASERGKRYFLRAAKQTTGIATINMSQLKAFPVLVPPLGLQERYVALLRRIANLRQSQAGAARTQDDLFGSLVHRAFRGELHASERTPGGAPTRSTELHVGGET